MKTVLFYGLRVNLATKALIRLPEEPIGNKCTTSHAIRNRAFASPRCRTALVEPASSVQLS
jgi:hypothetical protein